MILSDAILWWWLMNLYQLSIPTISTLYQQYIYAYFFPTIPTIYGYWYQVCIPTKYLWLLFYLHQKSEQKKTWAPPSLPRQPEQWRSPAARRRNDRTDGEKKIDSQWVDKKGNIYRKPSVFPWNMGFSSNFATDQCNMKDMKAWINATWNGQSFLLVFAVFPTKSKKDQCNMKDESKNGSRFTKMDNTFYVKRGVGWSFANFFDHLKFTLW